MLPLTTSRSREHTVTRPSASFLAGTLDDGMPLLLRFSDILRTRIETLAVMDRLGYQPRRVFPAGHHAVGEFGAKAADVADSEQVRGQVHVAAAWVGVAVRAAAAHEAADLARVHGILETPD